MGQVSAEKLEHTGPAEKERVAPVPQREQNVQSNKMVRGERVKVSESRTLAGERKIRARAWREKGGLHTFFFCCRNWKLDWDNFPTF